MDQFKKLKTTQDVVSILAGCAKVDQNELQKLVTGAKQYKRYYSFFIKKKSGQERKIRAPIYKLKLIQKCLSDHLYTVYQPKPCVKGYVKHEGIISNAALHAKQRWVLKIDLKDFFPSIHFGRIRGLFSKEPFNFPKEVAELLAEICVHRVNERMTELPQGAPTSPIISNLICRSLDRELMKLVKENRCYYSRYADDITISTNRSSFPDEICKIAFGKPEVSFELQRIIAQNGFRINKEKTSLRNPSARQMVTGLIVNEKVNVPREFIRTTRAMLWRREMEGKIPGLSKAQDYFESKDKVNRPIRKKSPSVMSVIRGRIQHIGAVRGWDDSIYLKLSKRLSEIDSNFEYDRKGLRVKKGKIAILAEGKTDYKHLKAALSHFQATGKYESLDLDFQEERGFDSDSELLNYCKNQLGITREIPVVCIFDRDNNKIVKQVNDSKDSFKDWGNELFSFAIPIPKHREQDEHTCIELYYEDEDLFREDEYQRRIFLNREFDDETGIHIETNEYYWRLPKKSLVVEDKVFKTSGTLEAQNVALSKNAFADYILDGEKPFDDIDFEAFSAIFDVIVEISEKLKS